MQVINLPQEVPPDIQLHPVGNGTFVEWLEGELARKSWKPADLARAANISTGGLSHVLNGERRLGPDMALAIARALGVPPEVVFRKSGLLPELPGPERDPTFQELLEVVKNMSVEERQEILDYALWRFRRRDRE